MPRPCTPQVLSWVLIRVCWFPYLPLHFLCLTREPWPAGRHGVVAHIGVTAGVLALAVPRRVDTAGRPGRTSLAAPPCRLGTALAPPWHRLCTALAPPPLATPQPTTACHSPPARATARQLAISLHGGISSLSAAQVLQLTWTKRQLGSAARRWRASRGGGRADEGGQPAWL